MYARVARCVTLSQLSFVNKTQARQLGLTPDDMKQVDSMWKNMDDLAESDPETYKKFTSDILAEGPPKKDTKAKSFIPTTSFVVKVTTSTKDVIFIVSLSLFSSEGQDRLRRKCWRESQE